MADVLVRGMTEETRRALKRRAKAHGRSVNAEVLAVLEAIVLPEEQTGLGTEIHEFAMRYGGFELEIERDKTPAGLVSFE